MPNPNDEDPKEDQTLSPSDEDQIEPENQDTIEGVDEDTDSDAAPGKKSAEARINELVSEVKSTKEELQRMKEDRKVPMPLTKPEQLTPQVQKAVEYLKNLGFTQTADVDSKVREIEDRMALNTEHVRLENSYDGADGRPKYSKGTVEEYMRQNGVFNPEVAYKAMHETELFDWALKKAEGSNKKRPFVERPGSSSASRDDSTITRAKIAERVAAGDREWYESNRDKIRELMAKGQL